MTVMEVLSSCAEIITPNVVISSVIADSSKIKSPAHHKAVFQLFKSFVLDFGAVNMDIKPILDYSKGNFV